MRLICFSRDWLNDGLALKTLLPYSKCIHNRFTDEVRCLVERTPTPVHWFIVDAGAITDIDYSAAQSIRDLLDDLGRQGVTMVFARVSLYLRSDMDRHGVTAAVGETQIFTTLHEAIVGAHSSSM